MKPTLAFHQLLMLSTSLLCFSVHAEQTIAQSSVEGTVSSSSHSKVGIISTPAQSSEGASNSQKGMQTRSNSTKMSKKSCAKADNPHRFEIKHIESKGIGYDQGYTSLDAFFTGNMCNFIPFIDLRAHVFNNGKWAANAGIGTRYVLDPCKSMVGINAYYDYRSTKHFHDNQVGAGIEAYYDRFEFLANGYLPVGRKNKRTSNHLDSITFSHFSGNYIVYDANYTNKYEGAMKGFNAEVGGHLAGDMKNYDLYVGIGPYYYDLNDQKHTWGGKARVKLELTKYLFLEGIDSWDHIFHNRVQGSVTFSVPFGVKRCYGKKRMPDKQMQNCDNVMDWLAVLPVDRQEIIVVEKYKKNQTIDPVAIDPTTGKPFYVVFVNNTNPNVGTGTFENPFSYLSAADAAQGGGGTADAQDGSFPDNTIYVFPGDGTNARMSTGMVLQEGQRMLGSAIAHTYATTAGILTIPPQSMKTPFITGTVNGSSAVFINFNNCEVTGFNIAMQTAFPAGNQTLASNNTPVIGVGNLAGTPLSNVTIMNNVLINETYGISLGSNTVARAIQGNIIITNNTISMHSSTTSTTPGKGIFANQLINANVLIENNEVTFNSVTGTGTADGINLNLTDQSTVSILNNTVTNMANSGIAIQWNPITLGGPGITSTCLVQNNFINNGGGSGLFMASSASQTIPGSIKAIVLDNTIPTEGDFTKFITNTTPTTSAMLLRYNGNTIPSIALMVDATTNLFYLEPPVNDNSAIGIVGPGTIIPIVPCQYGGPGCP